MSEINFDTFDALNRKPFADRLEKAIRTFYPFYDGAYVLSLNAKFGSGKTTFLKMWKTHLEANEFKVVYLNAWENDFDDEPLISISTEILNEIESDDTAAKKAKSALRGVAGAAALVGNAVLAGTTGINAKEILKEVEEDLQDGKIQKLGDKISEAFAIKKLLYSKLKDGLSAYLQQLTHKPLIVLVDELDRVRPDYAVKFLEAIKHIFSVPGVCFVLAVDRDQLKASVEQLYGAIDFDNYYRRFVIREADLPEAVIVDYRKFTTKLKEEYFDRKEVAGIPFILSDKQKVTSLEWISCLCYILKLTPRQTEHLFRVFVQFIAVDGNGKHIAESWLRASLFMIALSVSKNVDIYKSIGSGSASASEISNFIDTLSFEGISGGFNQRYLTLLIFAFALTQDNTNMQDEIFDIVTKNAWINRPDPNKQDFIKEISKLLDETWGDIPHNKSSLQTIYKLLEDWKDFFSVSD